MVTQHVPIIYDLERIKSKVVHCISHWNGGSKYEVNYIYGGRHVVDLNERTCDCGRWGLSGIPCFHAASAIIEYGELLETFVDNTSGSKKDKGKAKVLVVAK